MVAAPQERTNENVPRHQRGISGPAGFIQRTHLRFHARDASRLEIDLLIAAVSIEGLGTQYGRH
jgi:hypothetical protein